MNHESNGNRKDIRLNERRESMEKSGISLNDLKPAHEKAKIPTKENVSSLKDALASVLSKPVEQKKEIKQDTKVEEKKEEPKMETKAEIPPTPQPQPQSQSEQKTKESSFSINDISPKEVPEDVLRKLLQVDEPKI
jgi:hypothetical protein